jgi:hypothetical protein
MTTENERSPSPAESEAVIDRATVSSRAGGRPPEEGSSADPETQARAILEESEERMAERVRASGPSD